MMILVGERNDDSCTDKTRESQFFLIIHVSVTTRIEVPLRLFKKRDSCSCLLLRLLQFIYQNLGNSDFRPLPPLYFTIAVTLSKFHGPGFLSMSPHMPYALCRMPYAVCITKYAVP